MKQTNVSGEKKYTEIVALRELFLLMLSCDIKINGMSDTGALYENLHFCITP